jgi:phage shock protein A
MQISTNTERRNAEAQMKEDDMALLERVSMLLRANLNDLIDKAEDPERMLKQVVLDMENQLLQVKTQVAVAIADEHLLERKRAEQEHLATEWKRKAELAVQKGNDDLARSALERALSHDQLTAGFAAQAEDQKHEADHLRQALHKLSQKLNETRAHSEMLIAEHRRANAVGRAAKARGAAGNSHEQTVARLKSRVHLKAGANAAAKELLASESLEEKFHVIESEDKVEQLLNDMKLKMLPSGDRP